MATKIICDICGRDVSTTRVRVERNPILDIWVRVGRPVYDLCPECMGKLMRLLKCKIEERDT